MALHRARAGRDWRVAREVNGKIGLGIFVFYSFFMQLRLDGVAHFWNLFYGGLKCFARILTWCLLFITETGDLKFKFRFLCDGNKLIWENNYGFISFTTTIIISDLLLTLL